MRDLMDLLHNEKFLILCVGVFFFWCLSKSISSQESESEPEPKGCDFCNTYPIIKAHGENSTATSDLNVVYFCPKCGRKLPTSKESNEK